MKITKSQLKQLVKEEIANNINEQEINLDDVIKDVLALKKQLVAMRDKTSDLDIAVQTSKRSRQRLSSAFMQAWSVLDKIEKTLYSSRA